MGQLKGLSQTDEHGAYRLPSLDTGGYVLAVTSVGYKRFSLKVHVDSVPVQVNVTLLPDTVVLDQVIVHAVGPIQVKGDTVVYNAEYFKTGEEVALADLLKKLPGISVDEGGKVKFQGKDVVKVKIEDDDLFENNYQILTKNLSADLVEQVEVLQNYSDNRLLKNIENSEEVALNVTLKKDRENQVFGDGRLETNANQYTGRINLMSLAKKTKVYFLSTGNNIGSDPGGETEELMQSTAQLPGSDVTAEYLVPVSRPVIAEFKKDRYYFNDALLGSLNFVLRPAKDIKVTLNGMGYHDQTFFPMDTQSEYYTSLDTTGFNEFSVTKNRDRFGYLQAVTEYDMSKVMSLRYRGRFETHDGNIYQRVSLNLNNVAKQLESRTNRHDHLLNLTRKLTDRSALTLDVRYVSDDRPQHLWVDGNLLTDYFLPQGTSDTLNQTSRFSSRLWVGQLNWFLRSNIGKLGVKVGYENINQDITTDLLSPPTGLSTNDLFNRQGKAYAEGYYAFSVGKLLLTPGLSVQRVNVDLPDRPAGFFHFVNPKLGFRWRFSEKSRLSAIYSLSQITSTTSQLTRNHLLFDYNKVGVNDNEFHTFASRSWLITYEYGGWISGFSLLTNFYHHEAPSAYLTNTDIEPNYIVSTMNRLADREFTSLSLSMDQFITSLKTNLKLTWKATRLSFVTATEGVAVPTESFSHTLDGSLRTGLPGPFNAHAGFSVQTSATASNLMDAANYNLLIFVDGYLNAMNRRLNLNAHWERYELASMPGRPMFYFIDFNARFQFNKERGVALLLKGRNLLDEAVFAQRLVSNQSVATSVNRLIPRYLLAGIEFRF